MLVFKVIKTPKKAAVQLQSHNCSAEVGLCGIHFLKLIEERLSHFNLLSKTTNETNPKSNEMLWTLAMTVTSFHLFLPYQEVVESFESAMLCTVVTVNRLRVERNLKTAAVTATSTRISFVDCSKRKKITLSKLLSNMDYCCCLLPHFKLVKDAIRQDLSVTIDDSVKVVYHQRLHMAVWSLYKDIKTLAMMQKFSSRKTTKEEQKATLSISICFVKPVELLVKLTTGKRVAFTSPSLQLGWSQEDFLGETANLTVLFDSHTIVHSTNLSIRTTQTCKEADAARRNFPELTTRSNRMLYFIASQLAFDFPYEYDFGGAFEELLNLKKWIKSIHNLSSAPFKEGDLLPRDWTVAIDELVFSMEDDEFEAKLRKNHLLLLDECYESERRQQLLEVKLDEMRSTNFMLLTSSRIEELYKSLRERNAEIYVRRSKQLYDAVPESPNLFTWACKAVKLLVLADDSFHGKENVIKQIRQMDSDRHVELQLASYLILLIFFVV